MIPVADNGFYKENQVSHLELNAGLFNPMNTHSGLFRIPLGLSKFNRIAIEIHFSQVKEYK